MVHRRTSPEPFGARSPRGAQDERALFFLEGDIPDLELLVPPAQVARLKDPGRPYVHATLLEGGKVVVRDVAIKIKGAAGSTRPWEDKPALTVNTDKYDKSASFHGLDKFHLNNSVQDGGLLHEWISSETFRAARYPAARITHARLRLNGRDVGMYVLKEGFDGGFLRRNFADPKGNLYDGGFVQDIDAALQRDEGSGPEDRADIKRLVEACRFTDPSARWKGLAQWLDIPAFLTLMALERMLCHWDGYTLNVNNYRLYFDTKGKGVFIPSGMDQMLGDLSAPLFSTPRGMVASTVMENPQWRSAYRQRVRELQPLFRPGSVVANRIPFVAERLAQAMGRLGPDKPAEQIRSAEDVRARFFQRGRDITAQLGVGEPPPVPMLEFDEEQTAWPPEWKKMSQVADTKLDTPVDRDGRRSFSIRVGSSRVCVASWRSLVALGPGEYTFHAKVRTRDVVGLEEDGASAAGIRLSNTARTERVDGTKEVELTHAFSVQEERREVVLVCELRGAKGQVWFDGLRLTRVKPPEPVKPPPPPPKPAAKKPKPKPRSVPRKPGAKR